MQYVDWSGLIHNTYYYKITSVAGSYESGFSGIASATVDFYYDDCGKPGFQPHLVQGNNAYSTFPAPESHNTYNPEVIYSYTNLNPSKNYQVKLTFYDPYYTEIPPKTVVTNYLSFSDLNLSGIDKSEPGDPLKVDVYSDGTKLNTTPITVTDIPSNQTFTVPSATYSDGAVQIKVRRVSGETVLAKVSEIWIKEIVSKFNKPVTDLTESTIPTTYYLQQNYPNPFNPETIISFGIPKDSYVYLRLYTIQGKLVADLINDYRAAGRYSVNFNGGNLASGVYIYEFSAGDFHAVKKMLLVK